MESLEEKKELLLTAKKENEESIRSIKRQMQSLNIMLGGAITKQVEIMAQIKLLDELIGRENG
jgi:hypothetical protein